MTAPSRHRRPCEGNEHLFVVRKEEAKPSFRRMAGFGGPWYPHNQEVRIKMKPRIRFFGRGSYTRPFGVARGHRTVAFQVFGFGVFVLW